MKKVCLAYCLCFAAHVSFAKVDSLGINDHKLSSQPYFRVGMGYATKLSPDLTMIRQSISNRGTSKEVVSYGQTAISTGQGVSGVLGVGYYLGAHMAIEAAIAPGFSRALPTARYATDTSSYSQGMRAAPATTMQLNVVMHTSGAKLQFYSRAGILASFANRVASTFEGTISPGYNVNETLQLEHKAAMGFAGAFGLRKEIGKNVHLWAEASAVMLSSYIDNVKIKDATVNGVNIMNYLPASAATRRYDFSGTTTNGNEGTLTTSSDAYSNCGINAGVTFDLDAPMTHTELKKPGHAFLSMAVGYGAPLAGKTAGISGTYVATYTGSADPDAEAFELKRASHMAGVTGKVGVGYMLGSNVGFECDALLGLRLKEYSYAAEKYVYLTPGTNYEETVTKRQANSPLFVVPSVVLRTGGTRLSGQMRAGVVVPVRVDVSVVSTDFANITGTMGPVQVTGYKVATNFALGASMSAGLSYSISKHTRLFTEITGISYAPTAKSGTLTELSQFGKSVLDKVPEDKRTLHYSRSGAYGAGITSGYVALPSYTLPFGSIGFTVGVDVSL